MTLNAIGLRANTAAVVLGCAFTTAQVSAAQATWVPTKAVRLIVPQQPGSSNDTLARIFATKLSQTIGQQVVVDNRAGAGGIIGMQIAATAAPDGYTLVATATAPQVIAPHLHKQLGYDPFSAFIPLTLLAITQNLFITHPSLPAQSVKDFIALAQSKPGGLLMASAGQGSQSHLAGALFAELARIAVNHVPYKGAGASVTALLANESQFSITPAPAVIRHVQDGRLRALAIGGEKRSPILPKVPTVIEAGVPGYVSVGWIGLMAPQKTPDKIAAHLRDAAVAAVTTTDAREQLERQSAQVATNTPAEFSQFIRDEYKRYGRAVAAAKLEVN